MSTATQLITLEKFLKLPETKPPSEFINGEIIPKPMPQGQHSLIQIELCQAINQVANPKKIAKAFPELRCTFGSASIIPDISVFRWARIPIESSGKIANRFEIDSFGRANLILAELNGKWVSLTCFGELSEFDSIAISLRSNQKNQ